MADATKSLWSRWMEGGSENLSNIGAAKPTCPYDRKSCTKAHDPVVKSSPKSSSPNCHSGCPEPKRPLQPEEFCPDFGKAKLPPPPPCCFIRMQDPCAPCCCPPPKKCEDECYPGRKRDSICGCDLCKKKRCPDGKCCGPTEPSCQKAVRRCNSESQTFPEYPGGLGAKPSEIYRHPKLTSEAPVCHCKKDDISVMKFVKRQLDWLLCTPLKIPIPRIEWCYIKDGEPNRDPCNSRLSRFSLERKSCPPDSGPYPRSCSPHNPPKSKNAPPTLHSKTVCNEKAGRCRYVQDNPTCKCGPCRVRCLFEEFCVEQPRIADVDKRLENTHSNTCSCRICRPNEICLECFEESMNKKVETLSW